MITATKNYFLFMKSLLYTFIWIVDSSLCSSFNVGKNSDSGLPIQLEELTLEKYDKVANYISDFKTVEIIKKLKSIEVKDNQLILSA